MANKFLQFGRNSSSDGTQTLQETYEQSDSGLIITDSTRDALTLKRGSLADTDSVFTVKNGAGSSTMFIDGNGQPTIGVSGNNYSLPTYRATGTSYLVSDASGLLTWNQSGFDQVFEQRTVNTIDTTVSTLNNSLLIGSDFINHSGSTSNRMYFLKDKGAFRAGQSNSLDGAGSQYRWDIDNVGNYSFASGFCTSASGAYSYAHGYRCESTAFGSVAIGSDCVASGFASFASGMDSIASGEASHAECSSDATGRFSHSEGEGTRADGDHSHAGGWFSEASGQYSFVHGDTCFAQGLASFSCGDNCTASASNSWAIGQQANAIHPNSFVWGNSSTSVSSNGTGSATFGGDLYVGMDNTGGYRLPSTHTAGSGTFNIVADSSNNLSFTAVTTASLQDAYDSGQSISATNGKVIIASATTGADSDSLLALRTSSGTQNLTLKADGTIQVAEGSSSFSLPNTRGATGAVLEEDGSGNVAWVVPSANTIDEVFNASGITTGTTGQHFVAQGGGTYAWQDEPSFAYIYANKGQSANFTATYSNGVAIEDFANTVSSLNFSKTSNAYFSHDLTATGTYEVNFYASLANTTHNELVSFSLDTTAGDEIDEYTDCGWSNAKDKIVHVSFTSIRDFAPNDQIYVRIFTNTSAGTTFDVFRLGMSIKLINTL